MQDRVDGITRYGPKIHKVMRLPSVTSTMENETVNLTEELWFNVYLHVFATFPRGRCDDQVDSTSQASDWAKERPWGQVALPGAAGGPQGIGSTRPMG